jgi:hypothetical protein
MQRTELAHVLRASAEIAQEKSFVLIGSQAVLLLRIALLDSAKYPVQHITQWAQRRAQEASA